MEASEPKWVNPILDIIGVNSLRLGGLHIMHKYFNELYKYKVKVDLEDIRYVMHICGAHLNQIGPIALGGLIIKSG